MQYRRWWAKNKLTPFFIPHAKNNHQPHVLKLPSLFFIFLGVVTLQVTINTWISRDKTVSSHVLGFATQISQSEIIRLTNQERAKQGLSALQESSKLDQAAQLKAEDMFTDNYWAHMAKDGTSPWHWFAVADYDYLVAGENLAKDFNTTAGVVSGWMASETHRTNILNSDFTEIGVATKDGVLLGQETTLVVQLFGKPPNAGSLAEEPLAGSASSRTAPLAKDTADKDLRLSDTAQTMSAWSVSSLFNPRTWTTSQKAILPLLFLLMMLFIADSLILWHAGIIRKNSHSFLHATLLFLLILIILYSNSGLIL